MTTETEVRELVLAHLQRNPSIEFKLRDLPALIGVDLDVDQLPGILAPDVDAGAIVCRRAGRGVFFSSPAEEENEPPPSFNAALWADGDLVLVGVELNPDGHSITLTPDRVRLLCRLLHGQGPEA